MLSQFIYLNLKSKKSYICMLLVYDRKRELRWIIFAHKCMKDIGCFELSVFPM